MPPIVRLDPAVLRAALGAEVVLREGQVLTGRVAEVRGDRGILLLRGAPVVARLPPGMEAGRVLRLLVEGRSGEEVVLRVVPEGATPAQGGAPGAPIAPWVPLPGGARARVQERDARGGEGRRREDEEDARRVVVRFEGPALGPLDLVLELDAAGRARATVRAAPAALAALRAAAGELEGALGGGAVRVESRGEELDLRA